MLFINLLPEDKRAIVRKNIILNLLISTLEFFVLLAILISSVFVAGRSVLENNFNRAVGQNALINKNFGLVNQEIKGYNNQFKQAYTLLSKTIDWSLFLRDVMLATPANVSIHDLNLTPDQKRLIITGFAAHREDLSAFLDQLKHSDYIAQADSPLSNFFSRTDIIFEITVDLNMPAIEKHYATAGN